MLCSAYLCHAGRDVHGTGPTGGWPWNYELRMMKEEEADSAPSDTSYLILSQNVDRNN